MRRRKEKVTGQRILEELAAIGFARATDYLAVEDGELTVRDTSELSEAQGAAIAAIERGTGGVKLKFYDKLRALELLGKVTGLFDGQHDARQQENNLLEAIVAATGQEVDTGEISELQ